MYLPQPRRFYHKRHLLYVKYSYLIGNLSISQESLIPWVIYIDSKFSAFAANRCVDTYSKVLGQESTTLHVTQPTNYTNGHAHRNDLLFSEAMPRTKHQIITMSMYTKWLAKTSSIRRLATLSRSYTESINFDTGERSDTKFGNLSYR